MPLNPKKKTKKRIQEAATSLPAAKVISVDVAVEAVSLDLDGIFMCSKKNKKQY